MSNKWAGPKLAGVLAATYVGVGATTFVLGAAANTIVKPISIDPTGAIERHAPIDAHLLAPGAAPASAGGTTPFATADGAVSAGVWESDPTTLVLDMPIIEYIHVVEGTAVLRDGSGHSWTYKPGESFVLPQGFKGTATLMGHFKKEFVDVRPSGPSSGR